MTKRLDKLDDVKKPGAKNDGDKLRYDLEDDLATEALIAVMTFGANKYSPNGWRAVEDAFERYYGAMRRHAREFRRFLRTRDPAHRVDAETGFPHSAQFLCNAHFMCALDLATHQPDFDGNEAAKEALRRWNAIVEAKRAAEELRVSIAKAYASETVLTGKAKSGRVGGLASAKARRERRQKVGTSR
jgi:hypothetical protein